MTRNSKFRFTLITVRMFVLAALIQVSACSATSPVLESMDENTGVTILRVGTPFTMYRDTPGYGAYARNFLQVGAIDINRMGSHHYYLWLGVWSTDQVVDAVSQRDGFESVILFADGEPLLLDLKGWTPAAIGASTSVYMKPTASAAEAYYAVSVDQLRLIAGAENLRLQTSSAASRQFELWDEHKSARRDFEQFLQRATGASDQ